MQVKSIAECSNGEHSAILLTFIKLLFVIKVIVLSIFEWSLKTGFTVSPIFISGTDPPVRMVGGLDDQKGRVEIYHDMTGWGTVCKTDWTTLDANVFCRQLGFADGQVDK